MGINKSRLLSTILSPVYIFIDRKINKKDISKKNKKILLIFLGYIGDYVLFRNYIEEIKKDLKYKNYSITFCGNPLWKKLSESLDKKYVDEFIWIDRQKFLMNPIYRSHILKKISKESFEITLMPNHGRSFSADSIVKISNSINKIGNNGSSIDIFSWQKKISDKYYTKLISLRKDIQFEFLKNKDFFEKFLNKNLSTKLSIPFKETSFNEGYVVFVPGGGANFKRWAPKNFAKVADFIIQNKNLKVKILGSKNDSKLAEEIISHSNNPEGIENLTGNTLLNSIDLIGNSKLLVSNDTGPSHIAAATDTLTLCLSNGNQFGRFYPYPKKVSKRIIHIFPSELENKTFEELVKKYSSVSHININSILPEKVIEKINVLLG